MLKLRKNLSGKLEKETKKLGAESLLGMPSGPEADDRKVRILVFNI